MKRIRVALALCVIFVFWIGSGIGIVLTIHRLSESLQPWSQGIDRLGAPVFVFVFFGGLLIWARRKLFRVPAVDGSKTK